MAIIRCKICGGDIEISDDKTLGTCEYCGSTTTFPAISDDQRIAAFNRGNSFRMNGDFDRALAVYERIVSEDDTDAEAHWCCALCRFGIEYVEDPESLTWIPTCHRLSFDSFLEDVDYLAAVDNSDGITKKQYQKEAIRIAQVQKGILATSQNEKPFDVFICYKESDDNGNRTVDSVLAQDIYYRLTEQGKRVFFSRITLEDKAGAEYEPYIFAALNSAKVMIVIGTKPEYFNAAWVKNEWSRFLAFMKTDKSKVLLPCYRDMDAYDLPEALSIIQSYDMSKIGFLQDLIHGVNKVLETNITSEKKQDNIKAISQNPINTKDLVERGFIFLEEKEWKNALKCFNSVIKEDIKNSDAYLGLLLCKNHVRNIDHMKQKAVDLPNDKDFNKAKRFATPKQITILDDIEKSVSEKIEERKKRRIKRVIRFVAVISSIVLVGALCFGGYEIYTRVIVPGQKYEKAQKLLEGGDYEKSKEIFMSLGNYKDSKDLVKKAQNAQYEVYYKNAVSLYNDEEYGKAYFAFIDIDGYKDSKDYISSLSERFDRQIIAAGDYHTLGLKTNGTVAVAGNLNSGKCKVDKWTDIVSIAASDNFSVGLRKDGTVVIAKDKSFDVNFDTSSWEHITAIAAGYSYIIGLKEDGTVIATGDNNYVRNETKKWTDIIHITCGNSYVVGVKKDNTIVALGDDEQTNCALAWSDIVAVGVNDRFITGIKSDGSAVTTDVDFGSWEYQNFFVAGEGEKSNRVYVEHVAADVSNWKNIVSIMKTSDCSIAIGITNDHRVNIAGTTNCSPGVDDYSYVSEYSDILAATQANDRIVLVSLDGSVYSTHGYNAQGQCDVYSWSDIGLTGY